MNTHRMLTRLGIAIAGLVILPTGVFAQTAPSGDNVGIGYSFLKFQGEENVPIGWNLSLAGGGTAHVSGVADFGGHYERGGGDTWMLHTFQGGVRVGARRTDRVIPFAQALFGGAVATEGDSVFIWVFQPGAGVDIPLRPGGPAFRTQVDFPIYMAEGERVRAFRWTVGVALPVK
jgi:hypothetical protein